MRVVRLLIAGLVMGPLHNMYVVSADCGVLLIQFPEF